jgi:hypothetical protein
MVFEAPEIEISSNAGDPTDIRNITGTIPLPSNAATAARQDTGNASLASIDTKTPALASGRVPVDGSGVTQPISAASLPLPAGAATSANQSSELTLIGGVTETAPATDTASSGLNGRLQRIAQRITDLIAVFNPLTSAPSTTASGIAVRPITAEYPTFSIVATAVAVGNNKSMLSIQNTGTAVVRIREIWIINDQTTAVTGVAGIFEVRRIASFSAGTAVTPVSYDTADNLPAGISAATGATVATETSLLRQGVWSTDEWGPGTSDVEAFDHSIQNTTPFFSQTPNGKALTIRQNQGIHIKFATNSTAGAFNLRIIFTTE